MQALRLMLVIAVAVEKNGGELFDLVSKSLALTATMDDAACDGVFYHSVFETSSKDSAEVTD